ncbi:MAG TPA: hypothetical protein VJ184_10650 [Chryseolinea sp.]|nr:hypothetical protein [Chryseolinea sp.]
MRHIFFLFLFCTFVLGIFSCEDQEKFGLEESDKAFNLRVVPDKGSFDISAGDPSINFTMYSDTKTIDKVTILVELAQFGSDGPTSRAVLKEIPGNVFSNSSSSTVSIKLSEFASAVGFTVDELAGGDIFNIYNQVSMNDGRVYPDTILLGDDQFINVENSFFTAAGSTSFTGTIAFPVLCPFVPAEAAGTYTVTRDDFETYLDPNYEPEVIPGPGPNQVTFINLFGHPEGYDVIVDVDPVTDVATVHKQVAWHADNFGVPFGEGSIEGGGFYFSCTGFITVDLEHTVDAGSFGTFKLELTKKP